MRDLPLIAGAVVLLFCGAVALPFALFLSGFLWIAGLALLATWIRRGASHRYSLQSLREFHERETAQRLAREAGTISHADGIVCPHCMQTYLAELPCCPHCGR